jgi:phosphohistidine phosphatase
MKTLLLLRHAKSSWTDDATPDFARPLAPRGERDAPAMGERLRTSGITIGRILSSPALRARRTAELVAAALRNAADDIELVPELYLAAPRAILDVIARQLDTVDSLLVVGHNPGLTELANALLPELDLDHLPPAAVVAFSCDAPHWAQLATARRELAFYDFPKNRAEPIKTLR